MNRRELDELMAPRDLPDRRRMLRTVLDQVSAERAQSAGPATPDDHSSQLGFSDSAFVPVVRTRSRRWFTAAVAAATAVVVGGLGWSVVIRSPLAGRAGPGGQSVAPVGPTRTPAPGPEATPTPTPRAQGQTVPPSVTVIDNRAAGSTLFVTYRICSGSGVATLTGPFANRDTGVALPAGMPPRMAVHETIGPDQCILRGEAIARPDGPVSGRLDVRISFAPGTPEKRFDAYYGDSYGG